MRLISWKLKNKVKEVLLREKGAVRKDGGPKVRVCLVYPNTYSLGMTNLGFQMVYRLFNDIDYCSCERAFLPEKEDIGEYQRTQTPLFSYESAIPLKDFDMVAFSIPFEDDYLNIPGILALSGIPLLSSERDAGPIIAAGGVAVSLNPEPVAEIMDLFLIGEGEDSVGPFAEALRRVKESGSSRDRAQWEFDSLDCVYVPSLYDIAYEGAKITSVAPKAGAKRTVKAAKNLELDRFRIPESFIITPYTEFKGTFLSEIERGCGRGCRFCAAGFLYLPPRWRDIGAVRESIKKGIAGTGKVGLVGTAVSEYPEIKEAITCGVEEKGSMTLSSLRMDRLDGSFVRLLKEGGYKTMTLAPEAGSERMRSVVNKGLTDSEIIDAIKIITEAGFSRIKLYFLIGLPLEADEDAEAIVDMAKRIRELMKSGELILSVNPFIPKPCTPFQWHGFEEASTIEKRLGIIKSGLSRSRGLNVKAMSARESFVQAYISRADRRAASLIREAALKGWHPVLRKAGNLISDSVYPGRGKEDILPWDIVDHGIGKGYLWREYQKGLKGAMTAPCNVGSCFRCGICKPEHFAGRTLN